MINVLVEQVLHNFSLLHYKGALINNDFFTNYQEDMFKVLSSVGWVIRTWPPSPFLHV